MFLIEVLLPAQHDSLQIRVTLTEKFGGLTAFSRAPAEGRWKNEGAVEQDEIIVLEIMASNIEKSWWSNFRRHLEEASGEEEIVIRYHEVMRL